MRPHRVLGYCRVSSREQADRTSLDTQRVAIERHCAERGYPKPIIRVEVESGSGERTEARVEQRALIDDVRAGDVVLVLDQDRWSRDTIHFLSSADEIRRRGGTLTSVVGGSSVDSPEERLTATQRAAFAEYERRRIMQRSERGMRHLHELGFHVYGRAPLGYRLVKRRLDVDPEAAELVRQIFAWCIEGLGVHDIATRFRASFPGVRGTDHALMARRIHDRTYLGEAPRDPRDPLTDWIAGRHEAIVDVATFERAQQCMRERAHGGRRANPLGLGGAFLGAGLIRCAHCKHVMSCTRAGDDGTITHDGWYACHYAQRGCEAPRARRDRVDAELERLTLARIESLRVDLARETASPKIDRQVDELGPVRRARPPGRRDRGGHDHTRASPRQARGARRARADRRRQGSGTPTARRARAPRGPSGPTRGRRDGAPAVATHGRPEETGGDEDPRGEHRDSLDESSKMAT